jgi:alpha-amylase
LRKYVSYLLSLGVDGFRIDAAKHLRVKGLEEILAGMYTLDGVKPFIYQEYYVAPGVGEDVYSYMEKYFRFGYVTAFNYGDFLSDAIKNKNIQKLVEYSFGSSWVHYPENRAVVVLDNHDTEKMMPHRLNYKYTENNGYVLAYIFMLAWPFGVPKVMSSFKFAGVDDELPKKAVWQNGVNTCFDKDSPWVAQHRWKAICNMVLFRSKTKNAQGITHIWLGDNQVAFARSVQTEVVASSGFVVINGSDKILKRKFETGLPKGIYYDLISCHLVEGKMQGLVVEVANYGFAEIEVKPHDAVCIQLSFVK